MTRGATYLGGLRVLEVADEQGEYCGRLLRSAIDVRDEHFGIEYSAEDDA